MVEWKASSPFQLGKYASPALALALLTAVGCGEDVPSDDSTEEVTATADAQTATAEATATQAPAADVPGTDVPDTPIPETEIPDTETPEPADTPTTETVTDVPPTPEPGTEEPSLTPDNSTPTAAADTPTLAEDTPTAVDDTPTIADGTPTEQGSTVAPATPTPESDTPTAEGTSTPVGAQDSDGDGVFDDIDNCVSSINSNQMDRDQDGEGDVCDPCPDDSPNDNEDGACGDYPAPDGDASLYIYNVVPGEGYRSVAEGTVEAEVLFNQEYLGNTLDAVHVTLVSEYGDVQQLPAVFPHYSVQTRMNFYPYLQPNTDYCVTVEVDPQDGVPGIWPMRESTCFTTQPDCGTTIEVGEDSKITKMGDTPPGALAALNNALESGGNDFPSVLLLKDIDSSATFPMTVDAALGSYRPSNDGNNLTSEGYSAHFDSCEINSVGDFSCQNSGSSVIHLQRFDPDYRSTLYLEEARINAKVVSSGNINTMTDYVLSGQVPGHAIDQAFAQLGDDYQDLALLIQLDIDTDGDGVEDAATFESVLTPQPLSVNGQSCE